MKVKVWYVNTEIEDEDFEVLSFHTLPRKGEAVKFKGEDWEVYDVRHHCTSPGEPIEFPEIYLEDGTTGFPN